MGPAAGQQAVKGEFDPSAEPLLEAKHHLETAFPESFFREIDKKLSASWVYVEVDKVLYLNLKLIDAFIPRTGQVWPPAPKERTSDEVVEWTIRQIFPHLSPKMELELLCRMAHFREITRRELMWIDEIETKQSFSGLSDLLKETYSEKLLDAAFQNESPFRKFMREKPSQPDKVFANKSQIAAYVDFVAPQQEMNDIASDQADAVAFAFGSRVVLSDKKNTYLIGDPTFANPAMNAVITGLTEPDYDDEK